MNHSNAPTLCASSSKAVLLVFASLSVEIQRIITMNAYKNVTSTQSLRLAHYPPSCLHQGQKPHDKSEEGTQSPANRTKSEHSAVALPPVPQGTVLHFVCVDDGRFTLSNMEHDLSVSGPTSAGLRIDHKMGYHRLLEESQQAGVELLVVYKDEEYRLPASASPSVPKS